MIALAAARGFCLEAGLERRLARIQKQLEDADPDLPCRKRIEIADGAELPTA